MSKTLSKTLSAVEGSQPEGGAVEAMKSFPGTAEASKTLSPAEVQKAARFLRRRLRPAPLVGIVLGSGLGSLAARLSKAVHIPYRAIPNFPVPTAEGHAGMLHAGDWRGVPVAILEGRLHLYEGWRADEVAFPVRVLALAGVKCFVLTCAAGGIAGRALPGRFMILSDHLNFQGANGERPRVA